MTSSFIKDHSLAIVSTVPAYNSSHILRAISNELAKEDKTNRFYALQWLWDYVAIHAKKRANSINFRPVFNLVSSIKLIPPPSFS